MRFSSSLARGLLRVQPRRSGRIGARGRADYTVPMGDNPGQPGRAARETASHEAARETADRIAIGELLDGYAHALDTKDWEALRACFAPDAVADYTSTGGPRGSVDEAIAWLDPTLAPFAITQHLNTNRRIEIDGDTARVHSYIFSPLAVERDGGLDLIYSGGTYEDRLVRTPDGWRIAERVARIAWVHPGGRGARPGAG